MSRLLFALSLGFGGLILAVQAGHAAPQCGARDPILAQLAGKYHESRRAIGLAGNAAVMELFAADSGSWTITVTLTDGTLCLIASGEAYQALTDPLPAKGNPA